MNLVSAPPATLAPATSSAVNLNPPSAPARLASLDALRGFDMFWIIGGAALVNAYGEFSNNAVTRLLRTQLQHVRWEGVRFFDLIYPLFLFLVGISIVLSLDRTLERDGRKSAVGRIVRRSVLLYLFNFIYNGGFLTRWPDMRVVSGVLAMIAASYLLAALIYCFFSRSLKIIAAITIALLLGNWALLGLVPFPDFTLDSKTIATLAQQAGSSDPAAISAVVTQRIHGVYEPGHNLSNYLDYRFIPGKMIARYYENQGLLSPLTSVTLCLAGIFAGRLLTNAHIAPRKKISALVIAGIAAIALGWLWGLELPVVKRLWTSSFCLVTAGYSALLLAAFYLVVDVWKFQAWCRPFVWIGVNPITIYMLVNLVSFPKLAERVVGGDVMAALEGVASGLGGFVIAAVSLALVLLVVRFLYQRRIFLRV